MARTPTLISLITFVLALERASGCEQSTPRHVR